MKLTKQEALNLLNTYCEHIPPESALERLLDFTFETSEYQKGYVLLAQDAFVHQWVLDDVIYNQSGKLARLVAPTFARSLNFI